MTTSLVLHSGGDKLNALVIVCGVNCYNGEFIELGKNDEGVMVPLLRQKRGCS